ncbi:MAG: MFS transporter, partial [Nanoarchaeota archaeon]
FAYPSWFSLFTTYLNKKHKGFEYAVYSTSVGIGAAAAAFFGAKIAEAFGFRFLFFAVGAIAFLGFLLLIVLDRIEGADLRREERARKKRARKRGR